MSIGAYKKIIQLEMKILHQGNEMNSKEARKFYDTLISYYKDYVKTQLEYWERFSNSRNFTDFNDIQSEKWFHDAEFIMKKFTWLQEFLKKFLDPIDQPTNTVNLNPLLRKQTFYIEMINSLVPKGELSSKDAKLQYDHVTQFYEKFVSNQSEIMTLVEGASYREQITVSKEIQLKVRSVQKRLQEISSPAKLNENFFRMDRSVAIDDSSGSLYENQKSIMDQIKMIEFESNNNPDLGANGAKILFDHLSQLYDSFLKNQSEIDTTVTGSNHDKELQLSREILVKVMSLRTKLKQKFAPEPSSSNESKAVDELERDEAADLISLLEVQKTLVHEIEAIYEFRDVLVPYLSPNPPPMNSEHKIQVESSLKRLPVLMCSFFSNHLDIGKLVSNSDSDLLEQKEIFTRTRDILEEINKQYEVYFELLKSF